MVYRNYLTSDTDFVVLKPFWVGDRWTEVGESAGDEIVANANLDALLSAGYLAARVPAEGYANLAPHVFNSVKSPAEIDDLIATGGETQMSVPWTEPQVVKRARELRDAEEVSKDANQIKQGDMNTAWSDKLNAVSQSPRPVELPAEELFEDSKKREAEGRVDDDDSDEEVTDVDDRVYARAGVRKSTEYTSNDDDPLKPEFEDSELNDKLDPEEVEVADVDKDAPPTRVTQAPRDEGELTFDVDKDQQLSKAELREKAEEMKAEYNDAVQDAEEDLEDDAKTQDFPEQTDPATDEPAAKKPRKSAEPKPEEKTTE